ncbi:MAG: hypothetical protein H6706_17400 [Myxococcales bacterium]|nr:hypothetical protein [Myxococcales bacterium]
MLERPAVRRAARHAGWLVLAGLVLAHPAAAFECVPGAPAFVLGADRVWWVATVLQPAGEQCRVRNEDLGREGVVPLRRLRTQHSLRLRVGARVVVRVADQWLPASLLTSRPDGWRVHFLGVGARNDDLVPTRRIRLVQDDPAGGPTYRVGQRIQVKWQGVWYDAEILDRRGDEAYLVRYVGHAANRNEWVERRRMRPGP